MPLTLSRRVGEGVTITVPASNTATEVKVRSARVRGQQTQLSISAPEGTKIMRDELLERDRKAAEQGAA